MWVPLLFHNSLSAISILIPFLFLSFVLPSYVKSFLPFLEVCVLLPAFSKCSVQIVLHVDVFFFFDVFVGEGEYSILFLHHLYPSPII